MDVGPPVPSGEPSQEADRVVQVGARFAVGLLFNFGPKPEVKRSDPNSLHLVFQSLFEAHRLLFLFGIC